MTSPIGEGVTNVLSMDVSPSNQCLGFGDQNNVLHLYSSVNEPILNPFAVETEFADTVSEKGKYLKAMF